MSIESKISDMSAEKQRALRLCHEYLMPNRVETWLANDIPLVMGQREAYRFQDVDGAGLLDFHLNGGVFNLGHRHPSLVEQLRDGLDSLDIGNHHFPSLARGLLAEKLASLVPEPLHYSVFTPSASEANDLAIKTARRVTGRSKIVSFETAYHGSSGMSGAVGDSRNAAYFNSTFPEDFLTVPFNDLDAVADILKKKDVAMVMCETLPATYGFPPPDPNYYTGLRELCDEHGTLLLTDEVQTGMGRSGHLWAIEHYGVVPDLLVTGKALSGGLYPIAALIMTKQVGAWLQDYGWGYVSSFGGAELGCHVGLKALEITTAPETQRRVADNSTYLRSGLDELRNRYSFFVDIRQLGVIFGLGFDAKKGGQLMSQTLYGEGIWAMFASFDTRYLQFKPGLLVDRAYCDEALTRFESALKKVNL